MTAGRFREYTDEELAASWSEMERRAAGSLEAAGKPHAVFRIGGHRFALPASSCRGVVPFREPTPLPSLPRHILGVAAIRGRPVSVTDLRVLLGLEVYGTKARGHLLLVRADDEETALKVDWVETIRLLNDTALRPASPEWSGKRLGLVLGEVASEDPQQPPVLLLNASRCLRSES